MKTNERVEPKKLTDNEIDDLNNYSTYQISEISLFIYEEYLKENLKNNENENE